MKKRICAAAAAVLIGLLAGCGSSGTSGVSLPQDSSAAVSDIGNAKASEIAFADAGIEESQITHLSSSRTEADGLLCYRIDFTAGSDSQKNYDYLILASDGTILNKEVSVSSSGGSSAPTPEAVPTTAPTASPTAAASPTPDASSGGNSSKDALISFEEAGQLALDRVPGATAANLKLELDHDDGFLIYEGEIHYNNMEYEFEIDASTGNFIKWSEDHHD